MPRVAVGIAMFVFAVGCGGPAEQPVDLLIDNAFVITGTGDTFEGGWIAVHEGKIQAFGDSETSRPSEATEVIDAQGLAVLPGLIDTHRHFLPYSNATTPEEVASYIDKVIPEIFRGLLANGVTTVMSPGDFIPEIYNLRARTESGNLLGPRIFTAGAIITAPGDHPAGGPVCRGDRFCASKVAVEVETAEEAQTGVNSLVNMGSDAIKMVVDRTIVPDSTLSEEAFKGATAEASALGVRAYVHLESAAELQQALEQGATGFVHTPMKGSLAELGVGPLMRERGIPISTTLSWGSEEVAAAVSAPWREESQRQTLDNIRYLVDEGVVVAFGTDNPPMLGPATINVEVRALSKVLSPEEVIASLTSQAARYLDADDRIGSIAEGKVADLVFVEGNPLDDLSALDQVKLVLRSGEVVHDAQAVQ